jgi:hypothetical protein
MDINGNFDWGDLPNFLDPNFGYQVMEGVYSEMERLGIPYDEIYNPENRAIAKLKIEIFNLTQTIIRQDTFLRGDIQQVKILTGKDAGLMVSEVFISGIQTIATSAVKTGVISVAAGSSLLSTLSTANPYFAIFFTITNLLNGIVIENRVKQYLTAIENRQAEIKKMVIQLRDLINQLPKQQEKIVEPPEKPPVNSAPKSFFEENKKSILSILFGLFVIGLLWKRKSKLNT